MHNFLGTEREDFFKKVMERARGKCVLCGEPATEAHHVMERKLFKDGGYAPENGAAVCGRCHWRCETTEISVEEVLAACGLSKPKLPPGMEPGRRFDKWGNVMEKDGTRRKGPLFQDDGCRKALAKGGFLGLFAD